LGRVYLCYLLCCSRSSAIAASKMVLKNGVCSRGEAEMGIHVSAVSTDPKHGHAFLDEYSLLTTDTLKSDSSSEIGRLNTSSSSHDRQIQRPDPLSFLENDSSPLTQENILQVTEQASENWSHVPYLRLRASTVVSQVQIKLTPQPLSRALAETSHPPWACRDRRHSVGTVPSQTVCPESSGNPVAASLSFIRS
jgi:hypothetical protein